MENIEHMQLTEVSSKELESTDGGFVALTILGVTYTATQVAAGAGALFVAGVGAGVAAAAASDN